MQAKKINSLLVPAYVEICEFRTASDVECTKPGNKDLLNLSNLFLMTFISLKNTPTSHAILTPAGPQGQSICLLQPYIKYVQETAVPSTLFLDPFTVLFSSSFM